MSGRAHLRGWLELDVADGASKVQRARGLLQVDVGEADAADDHCPPRPGERRLEQLRELGVTVGQVLLLSRRDLKAVREMGLFVSSHLGLRKVTMTLTKHSMIFIKSI